MDARLPVLPPDSAFATDDAALYFQHLNARLYEILEQLRPASGWQDMLADLVRGKPGGTSPTWGTFKNGTEAWKFADSQVESLHVSFHMPHDLAFTFPSADGTVGAPKLYPHIHWSPSGTNTGTVRFGIEYTYARGYGIDAFPASTTIYLEASGSGVDCDHLITETTDAAAIEDATHETDALMKVRVFRDGTHANDTFTGGVFIHYVDLHYFSDGLLTNERNRSAGALPWTKQALIP